MERELSDEAERIKADVDNDAERLKHSLTVNKARQAKQIDGAAETLRAHLSRMRTTMARCQVWRQVFADVTDGAFRVLCDVSIIVVVADVTGRCLACQNTSPI